MIEKTTAIQKIDELDSWMLSNICVNALSNPCVKAGLSASQQLYILGQYTNFPRNIVRFFAEATYNFAYAGYNQIADEMITNLNEELGNYLRHTDDGHAEIPQMRGPHYTNLRCGIKEGLGIDIKSVEPSNTTELFISTMMELVSAEDPAQVAGTVYALESTANPELIIVQSIADNIFKEKDKKVPKGLKLFFEEHIGSIEPTHKIELQRKCLEYVRSQDELFSFDKGFRGTIEVLNNLWAGLYQESHSLNL
jgi:hypothetical protein